MLFTEQNKGLCMISFRTPIVGVDSTVSHNVKTSILKEVVSHLYINDNIPILATQDIDGILHENWNLKTNSKDIKTQEKYIELSATEETDIESGYADMGSNKSPLLFRDKQLLIRPLYLNTKVSLTINIKSKSKSFIVAARDRMKLDSLASNTVHIHDVLYRYYIPVVPRLLIQYSFKFRKNFNLANDYTEYIIKHSDNRLSLASTQGGKNHIVEAICKESQNGIVGRYEFDLGKDIAFDEGYYSIEFTYTANYNKPTYIDTQYDIVMFNQQLPDELTVTKDVINTDDDKAVDMMSFIGIDSGFIARILKIYKKGYVRIPQIDNHPIVTRSRHESILFSVLVNIRPDDKRSLFNLTELIDIKLHDDVIKYLKYDKSYIGVPLESLFNLYLYKNGVEIPSIQVSVNEELDVYTEVDLELDDTYRVFMVLNSNRRMMSADARRRLEIFFKDNGLFKNEILLSLNDDRFKDYLSKVNDETNKAPYEDFLLKKCRELGIMNCDVSDDDKLKLYLTGLVSRGNGMPVHIDSTIANYPNKVLMKTVQTAMIMTHMKDN